MEIGLGHLQRCLSLAAALKQRNVSSYFMTNHLSNGLDMGAREGYTVEQLLDSVVSWSRDDFQETAQFASRCGAQVIVVDFHAVPLPFLEWLREAGFLLVVRDDLGLRSLPADIVLNGNADACRLPYAPSQGEALFLLGPEYAVLPKDFWRPIPRQIRETVEEILVVLGGADPANCMLPLLELLDRAPGEFGVTAVIGPFFQNRATIKAGVERMRRPIKLVESPGSMVDLMQGADLAISAAGQTLYELARTGCPTLAIQVSDNQGGQLRALTEGGCLCPVGDAREAGLLSKVQESLLPLLKDPLRRQAMAMAGQGLVDGQGAHRAVNAILDQWVSRTKKQRVMDVPGLA